MLLTLFWIAIILMQLWFLRLVWREWKAHKALRARFDAEIVALNAQLDAMLKARK